MQMTQNDREAFIRGEAYMNPTQSDWLPLISAWKNEDGSLTLVINAKLALGQKIRLWHKNQTAPKNAPDYSCTVKRDRFNVETGEILAKKGNEL